MPNAETERIQAAATEAAYQRALRADLDRRISALGATSGEAFGRIGAGDGVLVVVLFVIGPALVAWWFR